MMNDTSSLLNVKCFFFESVELLDISLFFLISGMIEVHATLTSSVLTAVASVAAAHGSVLGGTGGGTLEGNDGC